jgi:hypothetical protein
MQDDSRKRVTEKLIQTGSYAGRAVLETEVIAVSAHVSRRESE